ncbi:hypothetical protein [Archangium violaceum]|uniref:hypothetical protein n=1 Tax=Archangium violaceum TaxID=83451 RepID=UPI0036DE748C
MTDEVAQVAAAKAADEAARIVLRERLPTAVVCEQFRQHMQSILADPVFGTLPGSQVSRFQRVLASRKTFP